MAKQNIGTIRTLIGARCVLASCQTTSTAVLMGRMKMQVLKNQVPGGGIIKYGKTKYEWHGWKMQVQTVQIKSSTIK